MAKYQGMYLKLFNVITDAISMLQQAQAETEEMYLAQKDPEIIVLDQPDQADE